LPKEFSEDNKIINRMWKCHSEKLQIAKAKHANKLKV